MSRWLARRWEVIVLAYKVRQRSEACSCKKADVRVIHTHKSFHYLQLAIRCLVLNQSSCDLCQLRGKKLEIISLIRKWTSGFWNTQSTNMPRSQLIIFSISFHSNPRSALKSSWAGELQRMISESYTRTARCAPLINYTDPISGRGS